MLLETEKKKVFPGRADACKAEKKMI